MILIRPRPLTNESSRGYILRVSELNGLKTPRWLLSLPAENGLSFKGYGALRSILGMPECGLLGLRGPIVNLAQFNAPDLGDLPTRYWNTRWPRFCPCCLAESVHWRANWDLVFAVGCEKHGRRLHDCCPRCQKPLSWDRSHIAVCACGFDLRQSATESAPEDAARLAREIALRFQPVALPEGDEIEILRGLDLESLLRLVWFLGAYGRNAHRKPQKIVGLETVEVAGAMVEQAMAVLAHWPEGFYRLLDEIVARRKPAISSNKIGDRFGGFYAALYKSFPGPDFEFLRLGFEDYLRGHWIGQLARRNRRLSTDLRAEHEWVSIAEAARLLKMRVDKVRGFLEQGLLEGHLHETRSGRKMGSIRRESLVALANHKQDLVTLKEARALLGVSRKRANALLKQGLLKPVADPAVAAKTVWSFKRRDVLAIEGASLGGEHGS